MREQGLRRLCEGRKRLLMLTVSWLNNARADRSVKLMLMENCMKKKLRRKLLNRKFRT